jgi:hypothetical protein
VRFRIIRNTDWVDFVIVVVAVVIVAVIVVVAAEIALVVSTVVVSAVITLMCRHVQLAAYRHNEIGNCIREHNSRR